MSRACADAAPHEEDDTMTDTEMIRRLAMLLDAALPLLHAEAARERRREAGKRMRQITCQQRAEAAREMIAAAEERLGSRGYDD